MVKIDLFSNWYVVFHLYPIVDSSSQPLSSFICLSVPAPCMLYSLRLIQLHIEVIALEGKMIVENFAYDLGVYYMHGMRDNFFRLLYS